MEFSCCNPQLLTGESQQGLY